MESLQNSEKIKQDLFNLSNLMKNVGFDMNIVTISPDMICIKDFIGFSCHYSFLTELINLISLNQPVMIEGGHSSGKKVLLESIGQGLGYLKDDIIKISLGPHIDYRDLVGSYIPDPTTGKLEWKRGPLTMSFEGKLLIFDGWDQCPPEIAQFLIGILDNKILNLPNGKRMTPLKRFRICCTLNSDRKINPYCISISKNKWKFLKMPLNLNTQPKSAISKIFPEIAPPFCTIITDLFITANNNFVCSLRDLFKFCRHCINESVFKNSSQQIDPSRLLVFANDILCNACPVHKKKAVFDDLSVILSVNPNAAEKMVLSYLQHFAETTSLFLIDFLITSSSYSLLHTIKLCVNNNDPILIIGGTGVGKTTIIQGHAHKLNRRLTVINLGPQTEVSSTFGDIKPMSYSSHIRKLIIDFSKYFRYINKADNTDFLNALYNLNSKNKWMQVLKALTRALDSLSIVPNMTVIRQLKDRIYKLKNFIPNEDTISFSYITGALQTAIIEGEWVLLDEINLAPDEFFAALDSIISNSSPFFCSENSCSLKIHPEFRLFACMNPYSEINRQLIPTSLYNKFIKVQMNDIINTDEICEIVRFYLKDEIFQPFILKIASFYLDFKQFLSTKCTIFQKYFVTLRSLCRALKIDKPLVFECKIRQIYEALHVSLLSILDSQSLQEWEFKLKSIFEPNITFSQKIMNDNQVNIEGFPIIKGPCQPVINLNYIKTDLVKRKLKSLARIISVSNMPILLEGDTAVGKTSLVLYLARITGNHCIRVNNHEHTDVQDYIGSYTCDSRGQLSFNEGFLPQAMRRGEWVVLDELNLAPSGIIETLNRLLDENRELFIDETQEHIKAHDNFRIFATQNSAAHYSGRKKLSQALLNRFCILSFDEFSSTENLEEILRKRMKLDPKVSTYMINVMKALMINRKRSDVFSGKYSFITIRDLFRWASRIIKNENTKSCHFLNAIASIGFELIGSRCRSKSDKNDVFNVMSSCLPQNITLSSRFNFTASNDLNGIVLYQASSSDFSHFIWTKPLLRNAYLLCEALKHGDSILLVGETGCGKTSLCELFAAATGRKIFTFTCHSSMEAGDVIGGMTVRIRDNQRVFEWQEGLLPQAMKSGGLFLLDELSTAEDSVLERLNSVLENEKTLIIHENICNFSKEPEKIQAHSNFRFVSTMNPGGDYGKREISTALRNRLTEIWCESSSSENCITEIINQNLLPQYQTLKINNKKITSSKIIYNLILLIENFNSFSTRKLIDIIRFINSYTSFFSSKNQLLIAIYESISAIIVDSCNPIQSKILKMKIHDFLKNLNVDFSTLIQPLNDNNSFRYNFSINQFIYPIESKINCSSFDFSADDVQKNVSHVQRALLFNKPVMLEGPPGCGKTCLIQHLALLNSQSIIRINFSEQTELCDLIGGYFPFVDQNNISFSWVNGPFLNAIINHDWILLDEINLACQTVLEGLNSCFDHRSSLYVPELDQTFKIDLSKVRIFATQNPHSRFNGRKGLPKSFLDRFVIVNMTNYSINTLQTLCTSMFPSLPNNIILSLVSIMKNLSPQYDYNIRDAFRFFDLISSWNSFDSLHFVFAFYLTFVAKMRSKLILSEISRLLISINSDFKNMTNSILFYSHFRISQSSFHLGPTILPFRSFEAFDHLNLLNHQRLYLGLLSTAVSMKWPCLITGSHSFKTSLVKLLSVFYSKKLIIIPITSETDVSDLLGDFDRLNNKTTIFTLISKLLHRFENTTNSILSLKKYFDLNNTNPNFLQNLSLIFEKLNLEDFDQKTQKIINKIKVLVKEFNDSSIDSINWVNGQLVKSVQKGYWVLFDNINFGNPAVIDRLNSLLEPNGSLENIFKKERIIPHSDFRFFATYDPSFGEVSHALKNRCLEIYVSSNDINPSNNVIYPSINIIKSPNLIQDICLWDFNVLKSIGASENNLKLLFLEFSSPWDFEIRCNYLNLNFQQSIIYKTQVNDRLKLYSSCGLSDYCSEILSWNNYPLLIKSTNISDSAIEFRFVLYLRFFINNFLNFTETIKSKTDTSIKLFLKNLEEKVQEALESLTSLDEAKEIFILMIYMTEFLNSEHENYKHDLLLSWLCLILKNLKFNPKLHNLLPMENNNKIVEIYKKLYRSDQSMFFNFENQYLTFSHGLNEFSVKHIIDQFQNVWNKDRDYPLNFYIPNISIELPDICFMINQLIRILNNSPISELPGSHFDNLPPMIQAIFKIYQTHFIGFKPLRSAVFKSISQVLIGNNREINNPFVFSSPFKQLFNENLLKPYEPSVLLERYLYHDTPFSIKCKDLSHIQSFLKTKMMSILKNFNFLTSRIKIINSQLLNLLKSLFLVNFFPLYYNESTDISKITVDDLLESLLILFKNHHNSIFEELRKFSDRYLTIKNNHLTDLEMAFNLSESFKNLGMFLLKFYTYLPQIDPAFEAFTHNEIISKHSNELKEEYLVRNKLFTFMYNSESLIRPYGSDKSFDLLIELKDSVNSLNMVGLSRNRSLERYGCLFTNLPSFVKKIENDLYSSLNPVSIFTSISEFSVNIEKYYDFYDIIEPIQSSLMIIQLGLLYSQPFDIDRPQSYVDTMDNHNLDSFFSKLLIQLNCLEKIVTSFNQKCITKQEAFLQYLNLMMIISESINNILKSLEASHLIEASIYKYIPPDSEKEMFSFVDDVRENSTKKIRIEQLLFQVAYFIFKNLNCLINDIKSEPLFSHSFNNIISKTPLFETFVDEMALITFLNHASVSDSLHCSNIYEYGRPCYIPKINSFVEKLKISLMGSISSPLADEILSIIDHIQASDISAPFVIYLNKLDQIYRCLTLFNSSVPCEYRLENDIIELKSLIVTFRKEQFKYWDRLLEDCDQRTCASNSLMLLNFINIFLNNDGNFSILEQFIGELTLSTYSYTLNCLLNILTLLQTTSSNSFSQIFNFIAFYKQLDFFIEKYRHEKTEKIRKNLISFTKTAKWKDVNYWTLKESFERAHRVLHKYLKSYQTIQNYPINLVLNKLKPQPLNININIIKNSLCGKSSNHFFPYLNSTVYLSIIDTCMLLKNPNSGFDNIHLNDILSFLASLNLGSNQNYLTQEFIQFDNFSGPNLASVPVKFKEGFNIANHHYLDGLYRYTILMKSIISKKISSFETKSIFGSMVHLVQLISTMRGHTEKVLELFNKIIQTKTFLTQLRSSHFSIIDPEITDSPLQSLTNLFQTLSLYIFIIKLYLKNTDNSVNLPPICEVFTEKTLDQINGLINKASILKTQLNQFQSNGFITETSYQDVSLLTSEISIALESLINSLDSLTCYDQNELQHLLKNDLNGFVVSLKTFLSLSNSNVIYENSLDVKELLFLNEKLLEAFKVFDSSIPFEFSNMWDIFIEVEATYAFFDYKPVELAWSFLNNDQIDFTEILNKNEYYLEDYIEFLMNFGQLLSIFFGSLISYFDYALQKLVQECEVEKSQSNDTLEPAQQGGFRDGTGEEDVTDKIETQDQLEDAKKKEDLLDNDLTDNSFVSDGSGIEMSDMENALSDEGLQDSDDLNEIDEDQESVVSDTYPEDFNPASIEESGDECNKQDLKDKKLEEDKDKSQNESCSEKDLSIDSCSIDSSINFNPQENDMSTSQEVSNHESVTEEENFDEGHNSHESDVDSIPEQPQTNGIPLSSVSEFPKAPSLSVFNPQCNLDYQFGQNGDMCADVPENDDMPGFLAKKRSLLDYSESKIKPSDSNSFRSFENEIEPDQFQLKEPAILNEIENPSNSINEINDALKILPNNPDFDKDSIINQTSLFEKNDKNIELSQPDKGIEKDMEFDENLGSKLKFSYGECLEHVDSLSSPLCEQLRAILEPTRLTKYSGGFKTGRKLNIRKIMPYIASKFTKDRIWMRRTKPQKRDYHIVLALDDSASMSDNDSQKIALQSMLLLATAFRLLEIGRLSVLSFGESVKTLLDFDENCDETRCREIVDSLDFSQSATRISRLLDVSREKLISINQSSSDCERLLIILSDGRGIFSEGEVPVHRALSNIEKEKIFTIFIILDVAIKESLSISRIQVPIFTPGSNAPAIKSYLELFPFPYYIILRNIHDLPDMLCSITRQWLEFIRT